MRTKMMLCTVLMAAIGAECFGQMTTTANRDGQLQPEAILGSLSSSYTLSLVADDVSMVSPSTDISAFFDVYFTASGDVPDLAGYQFALELSPTSSGVSLTGATTPPDSGSHPPVFPTGTPSVSRIGNQLHGTDFLSSGASPINDGMGLVRVQFSVQAGTVGTFTVHINTDPNLGTLLSDGSANSIAYAAVDGTITIVPEPQSATGGTALVLLAALAGRAWLAGTSAARAARAVTQRRHDWLPTGRRARP